MASDGVTTPAPIQYRVAMSAPATHEFEVEMRVPALPDRDTVEIVFPTWAPGSYLVRDFVRHVSGLAITDAGGRRLASERLDKQRWRIWTDGRPFRVRYRVFAFEASVRTSFLDDSHGYWNGTSLFFHVAGELERPCRVTVVPPARSGWRVATALPRARGGYAAADFDDLVDAPFEIGTHETRAFAVGRTKFELALYGRCNADSARLVDILRRIVVATGKMFGGFPFDRYLFIVHALPVGSGGLERSADMRYRGQEHAVRVPIASGAVSVATVEADFHALHRQKYTFDLEGDPVEIVTCHVSGFGGRTTLPPPPPPAGTATTPAAKGRRRVDFDADGVHEAVVFDRRVLPVGFEAPGPVVVEDETTTALVHPGQTLEVDEAANLVVWLG